MNARVRWLCSALVCGASTLACGPGGGGSHSALDELERLAFVPPGESPLPTRFAPGVVCENREALLVDRYEVTRRDFKAWIGSRDAVDPLLAAEITRWTEATLEWPASFMAQDEARAYAAQRGLRLLTASEWLRTAAGTDSQPWPWGPNEIQSAANTLLLRLDRPSPVGTFEQGRTPFGTYDMLGNVWEWVEEPIRVGEDPNSPMVKAFSWALGGSYASRQRRISEFGGDGRVVFHAEDLDPASRASDLGFRCGGDARTYLLEHAAALARAGGARERLVRIGARWGRNAAPFLDSLAREPGASACFTWLREGAQP